MNEMQRSGRKIYSGTEQAKLLIQEGFTRFTKEKISCYEGYLRRMNGPTGSYMRVANILCWGFYSIPYIREVNGFALIVNDDAYYGHFSVLMPVGDYEDTEGLKACLLYGQELMDKLATECVFLQAKDWMRPYLDRIQGLEYSLEYNEAESDYIYPLLKMQESMERRHVHYGEKIRHFTTEHDPEINCYQKEDFEACLAIIQKQHCDQDGCSGCVFGCIREWFSILTESLNELHAQIYVVRSYNKRDVHGSGNESGHGSCNERVHGSGNETGNCNENGKVLAFITMIRDEDLLY
ncbi:MAG: hypothetical protein KBT01_02885, partial [Clostridiales bacterium]|nr:hypothetical protein [Candidatus Blautia equi]